MNSLLHSDVYFLPLQNLYYLFVTIQKQVIASLKYIIVYVIEFVIQIYYCHCALRFKTTEIKLRKWHSLKPLVLAFTIVLQYVLTLN